ncbi:helix-turn-helix domain-containing protein [Paenibacillus cymbidii]|uniref:helix-turn-helix domain-containing protein n=1 Tax=Paenibacillus cymbidii TaxID=1639034 RepID=UPI001436947C|nr:helix-turn-helix domain-containing protein [Paenibacillus cymbidii]
MIDKVWRFTRRKHFLFRLITYMLLICLVPIVVLSYFFYYNVQSSMRQEIKLANDRYLNQTVNAMELVVKQIGNGYRHLVINNSLVEFDQSPLGDYFTEIGKWQGSESGQSILSYIDSKAKVMKSMVDLRSLNDFIYSVYYINPSRGIVLTSGSLQYALSKFYDQGWDQNLKPNVFGYPIMMDVRDAKQVDGSLKRVIPIAFRPAESNYTVVINLDAEAFYTNLISKLGIDNGTSLILFSKEGEPLLYDGAASTAEQIDSARSSIVHAELDESAGGKSGESMVDKDRLLISWKSSDLLGWRIASVTDLNKMYGNVLRIRGLFFMITFLLLIATASLAFVSGRRMYMPVSRLLQFIKNDHQADMSKEPAETTGIKGISKRLQGEFQVISESLTNAYETRNRLQLRLRESLPAYQEKFIRSLLRKNAFQMEDIEGRLSFLGIGLQTKGIGLMLISIEEDGRPLNIETEKLKHLLVIDTISSAIDSQYSKWVIELSDHVFLVLVNCGENGISAVFAAAEAIRRSILTNHEIVCTVGIGSYCHTIEDLPQAYKEAEESLSYRNMTGDSEIVYIEDVRLQSYDPLPYPKDKETTLIVFLKNGDKQQALSVFADMVQDMRGKAAKVAFPQVQQAFLLLLVKLIETVRDLSLDMNAIVPEERPHLLAAFLQRNDWLEMSEWFENVITKIADYIGDAFREKKNMHVEHARRMIEDDCGDMISLTTVAEKLNLNPAYLSRIFKEYTATTFTEYVTRTRIAKSKKLLLQPELKIQDISKQLGYTKVNHFIKIFKEATGITPGEFRKLNS